MKTTFPLTQKAQKNGKNIKICLAKTKTKKTSNNNKRIRMF